MRPPVNRCGGGVETERFLNKRQKTGFPVFIRQSERMGGDQSSRMRRLVLIALSARGARC